MIRVSAMVAIVAMACGGEVPAVVSVDAGDGAVTTALGTGTCPEGARACGNGIDSCFGVNDAGAISGGGDIRGCLEGNRCRPIPPPCWVCPRGAKLWRRADIEAFNRAVAATDGGVCPAVGDGGVDDVAF